MVDVRKSARRIEVQLNFLDGRLSIKLFKVMAVLCIKLLPVEVSQATMLQGDVLDALCMVELMD